MIETMPTDDRDATIGRAVRRLVELAAADATLRAGLETLARTILEAVGTAVGSAGAAGQPPPEAMRVAPEPAAAAGIADAREPGPADRAVEPMDPVTFMRLMEEVARQVEPGELGTVAASLQEAFGAGGTIAEDADGAGRKIGAEAAGRDVRAEREPDAPTSEPVPIAALRDAVLPGLAERTRIKAAVARAAIERLSTGEPIDEALLHRARSAHCSLWVLDLVAPDAADLAAYADCLDAVADGVELVRRVREHHPDDHARFVASVRWLAAVQSALRIATTRLSGPADEDQVAVFKWLKETTAADRIYVERHMQLKDPLDPAHIAGAVAPIRAELDALHEERDREEARVRGLRQVRYHAGRIAKGKGDGRDGDKIVEAVVALVEGGLPPSNLELRALLMPIVDRLPAAEDRPAAYGRVFADLELNRDWKPRANGTVAKASRAKRKPPTASDDVRRAATLLRGTELVLIGGERRVEAEQAIRDAFGLADLAWLTLSDDPTLDELERTIARPEVSAVIQLIRWSRHRHGDAADLAEEHGKPFVRVPGGYNPNALARAILAQASERLEGRP